MSKIVCDICGTTYPETASQCPICGAAKKSEDQTSGAEAAGATYSYVKGGRFSKGNVRRRTQQGREPQRRESPRREPSSDRPSRRTPSERQEPEKRSGAHVAMVVIVVVLLLAIIAVLGYLVLQVLLPGLGKPDNNKPNNGGNQTPSTSETTDPVDIPCENLELGLDSIEFDEEREVYTIAVVPTPANTTDPIYYSSSDPSVAAVDSTGKVTAVGGGFATITVTCGEFSVDFEVTCSFGQETTEEPSLIPEDFVLEFDVSKKWGNDVTFTSANRSWKSYKSSAEPYVMFMTWTTDNPKVAIVENGIVTTVGPGTTKIHAEYNGKKYTCTIRCSFKAPAVEAKYKLNITDVTLYVGGAAHESQISLNLISLENGSNYQGELNWTASTEGYVEIDGKVVKAVKSTYDLKNKYITVSVTLDGTTYSCIVRVAEKVVETEPVETTAPSESVASGDTTE